MLAVGELKEKLSASDIVIGNGLMNYDFLHGLGTPPMTSLSMLLMDFAWNM